MNFESFLLELVYKMDLILSFTFLLQLDFETGVVVAIFGTKNEAKIKFEKDNIRQPMTYASTPGYETGESIYFSK